MVCKTAAGTLIEGQVYTVKATAVDKLHGVSLMLEDTTVLYGAWRFELYTGENADHQVGSVVAAVNELPTIMEVYETTNIDTTSQRMTLPTDSKARKEYPLMSGCLNYFPAALAGVAKISKIGNDKHNPGEELHHDRNKSMDHGDCIIRHLTDVQDLLAAFKRGDTGVKDNILLELSQLAWRALAYSQETHERFGAPLAPGAITNKAGK